MTAVLYAMLAEVLIIAIIAAVLKERMTLEGVVANGALVAIFAGTLLYDQKAIGFLVLVYAIFLITFGIKEYMVQRLGRQTSFGKYFDRFLEIIGHNYFVLGLMLAVLAWVYIFGG